MQDAVAVDVLGRIVGGDRAVQPARGDHRNLALEGDEGFQDQRHIAHRLAGAGKAARFHVAEDALALAVIAHAPGFQDAAAVEFFQRRRQFVVIVDGAEIGGL